LGLRELLTPSQVAEHLGVCRATIYKLIRSGQLASVCVGAQFRVPAARLADFVAGRRDRTARKI